MIDCSLSGLRNASTCAPTISPRTLPFSHPLLLSSLFLCLSAFAPLSSMGIRRSDGYSGVTKVADCGLVCCSWFSHPNECSATSVTHHWKGNFRPSQKSESEFLFRALTGGVRKRQFRRIRSGAPKRDGQLMTCYTSPERKFKLQSIHRATISVAATRTGTNRSQTQSTAADQNFAWPHANQTAEMRVPLRVLVLTALCVARLNAPLKKNN